MSTGEPEAREMWLKDLTCSICGKHMDVPGGEVQGKPICKTCFQQSLPDKKKGDQESAKAGSIDRSIPDMTTEEMLDLIEREVKEADSLQAMSGLNNIETLMHLGENQRPAVLASAALLKLVRALVIQNQLLISKTIGKERYTSQRQRLAEFLSSQQGYRREVTKA